MKKAVLITLISTQLYEDDFEEFMREDLQYLQGKSTEIIQKVQELANDMFCRLSTKYKDVVKKYEHKQQKVLDSSNSIYYVIKNSIDLNSNFRKEMNKLDSEVLRDVVKIIQMKTAFGRIVLEAILNRSKIQWGRPIVVKEASFSFSDDQLNLLKKKLRKFFFESYTSGKSLKVYSDKNYREAVSTAVLFIPECCGSKIYDILLPNQMRQWVKSNEAEIQRALNFIPKNSAEVVKYYFGLDNVEPCDLQKISAIIEKPKHKVAKLLDIGIKKMKWKIRSQSELSDLI